MNNVSFEDQEESKHDDVTDQPSKSSSSLRSSKFTVDSRPAAAMTQMDKRKKDNRKLFNVESSASVKDDEKRVEEYSDTNSRQHGFAAWYAVRGSNKFDIMSGASGLNSESSSFGGPRESMNNQPTKPHGFTSSSESQGFENFLKT